MRERKGGRGGRKREGREGGKGIRDRGERGEGERERREDDQHIKHKYKNVYHHHHHHHHVTACHVTYFRECPVYGCYPLLHILSLHCPNKILQLFQH